ncbi:hypothetical protein BB561_004772 [Smittium simulii]|uniref:Apoptogenic protein 1, mitochondrial n=1 Tax=Smittium simulii TaxID=133385 RepID=A0A2T9YEC2_9FUNG|nr:hypothetical protein BB561_004772 [Smittium simulii]
MLSHAKNHLFNPSTNITRIGVRSFNLFTKKYKTDNKVLKAQKRKADNVYSAKVSQSSLTPGEFMVGQPDPVSNLRPFKLFKPFDETKAERCYRLLREEAERYNQDFWSSNNLAFQKGITDLETKAASEGRKVSDQELSEYYKLYLNSSYIRHATYNRGWWKRNVFMIVPALIAQFNFLRLFKRRKDLYMSRFANSEIYSPEDYDSDNLVKKHNTINPLDASKLSNSSSNDNSYASRRKEKIDSYY